MTRARSTSEPDWGHRELTLRQFTSKLDALPAGSRLIDEDAVTVVLAAATDHDVTLVPLFQAGSRIQGGVAVDGAFAMPRAQRVLGALGFAMEDVSGAEGLARAHRVGECRGVTSAWRTANDLLASDAISLAARSPDEVGPVIVYLFFTERPNVHPIAWGTPRHRGLYWTNYELGNAAGADRFSRDVAADGLTAELPESAASYAVRLELSRARDSPQVLTAGLGARPIVAIGRMQPGASPNHISVCPAFPREIAPLVSR
jgi:hypothetical protein